MHGWQRPKLIEIKAPERLAELSMRARFHKLVALDRLEG